MPDDRLSKIADRLDRTADRLRFAQKNADADAVTEAASRIRAGMSIDQAQALEAQFTRGASDAVQTRLSTENGAAGYEGGSPAQSGVSGATSLGSSFMQAGPEGPYFIGINQVYQVDSAVSQDSDINPYTAAQFPLSQLLSDPYPGGPAPFFPSGQPVNAYTGGQGTTGTLSNIGESGNVPGLPGLQSSTGGQSYNAINALSAVLNPVAQGIYSANGTGAGPFNSGMWLAPYLNQNTSPFSGQFNWSSPSTALAGMSSGEMSLVESVINAPQAIIGRSINIEGQSQFTLDNWLIINNIDWTQRWQDVYNKALYLRTVSGLPVNVMGGGGWTAGEANAAEAGAEISGVLNAPYWPNQPPMLPQIPEQTAGSQLTDEVLNLAFQEWEGLPDAALPPVAAGFGALGSVVGGVQLVAAATSSGIPDALQPFALVGGVAEAGGGVVLIVGALAGDAALMGASATVAGTGGTAGIPVAIWQFYQDYMALGNLSVQAVEGLAIGMGLPINLNPFSGGL